MNSATLAVGNRDQGDVVRPAQVRIETRKSHLEIEGRFKDLGSVYWCFALVWIIANVTIFGGSLSLTGNSGAILFFYAGVPALLVLIGYGVFTISPWARPFAWLICLFLLVIPPRGTHRGLEGLSDLASAEGRYIVSKPYREIRKQTRHIKASMSALNIAILGFFGVVLIYVSLV